MLHRIVS